MTGRHRGPYDLRAWWLDTWRAGDGGNGRHGRYLVIKLPAVVAR